MHVGVVALQAAHRGAERKTGEGSRQMVSDMGQGTP